MVTLSVCDPPLSEVVAKSGATGFDGAVESMVIGNAIEEVEVLPAGSVNVDEMFQVPSVSVGSVQFVAEPMT